jgi:hypothetical protein
MADRAVAVLFPEPLYFNYYFTHTLLTADPRRQRPLFYSADVAEEKYCLFIGMHVCIHV